ncbi:hypothetical protein LZ578_06600 [Jeotgalibaca sp. MA1X17-3]|uniref:hypothetical protein n=1 Tax=Jeotgalibaca sp. MA1X17-3 TaxID=2908211 RepID=UPI001F3FCFCB|nr:hypothetical protein [Jeotgalibaca sp. MA1X17-3]UJF14705.1 hypothetical protein LZ578_06600 [Jeotgalibaca sp. MA1X17-3]
MEAFQYNDFPKAVEYLTKALAIQKNEELLQLCLTMMQDTEQFLEGVQLLKLQKPELWNSTDVSPLDVHLITFLIYAKELDEAKEQISKREKVLSNGDSDRHLFDVLQQNLNIIEEKQKDERNKKIAVVQEESTYILNEGYHRQAKFLKEYTILPEKELRTISQSFLTDQKVHAFLKTDILQTLIQKQIDMKVTISKESYSKTLNIKELYPIQQSLLLIESQNFFAKYDIQNPELQKQMETNFFLHCAYYYPFEKEVLYSVVEWQEAMNQITLSTGTILNKEEKKLIQNIQIAEKNLNILTDM